MVGAGFAGACYARMMAEAGYYVDVIDARPHIAGNAYDHTDPNGIRRHMYGPHLFHTNNSRVVEWISQFGEWIPYHHKVRAKISDETFVPLPINIDTINTFFNVSLRSEEQVKRYLDSVAAQIENPSNAAEYLYSKIGKDLTDTFFRRYTKKMWELDLEEMSIDVVKRIPIRYDHSELYFPDDKFQMLPSSGYVSIFERIFDHKHIGVSLNTTFERRFVKLYLHTFNSMPIDVFYDFEYGELPYRSIKFHHATCGFKTSRNWSVTNFTDTGPVTRETDWHVLPGHVVEHTGRYTRTREEPCNYTSNNYERYYPVKTADGRYDKIYAAYKAKADMEPAITFIGRCGTYQYLDMDQVINQSLMGCARWLQTHAIRR